MRTMTARGTAVAAKKAVEIEAAPMGMASQVSPRPKEAFPTPKLREREAEAAKATLAKRSTRRKRTKAPTPMLKPPLRSQIIVVDKMLQFPQPDSLLLLLLLAVAMAAPIRGGTSTHSILLQL